MADTSKYKSVSLRHETYEKLKYISKNVVDVDLSLAHTISYMTDLMHAHLNSPNNCAPLRGDNKYQTWKKNLLNKVMFKEAN